MTGPEDDLPTLIARQDHLNVLRHIRSRKIREPQTVVTHGKLLLGISDDGRVGSPSQRLGDAERLAALEQLCAASLDVGGLPLADSCLDAMRAGSPGSPVAERSCRYRGLLGMRLEASGDYDGASAVYDALLRDNPSNARAARRRICVLAARRPEEAAAALNDYLSGHPGDIAAWHQMAEVCLSASDYPGAAYCYEEVLLGCPLDSGVHCRLGEAYCTAGGLAGAKLARKHLAQAVQLDPNNLRAWYGLIGAAEGYLEEVERIGGKGGGKGSSGKREAEEEGVEVAKELVKFGGEKLMQVYKGTKMMSVVERMLKESSELL